MEIFSNQTLKLNIKHKWKNFKNEFKFIVKPAETQPP